MTAWRLDSSSDRMWALRPKPLPAEFPSQAPSPQPYPQVCSFSSSRPGPQACRSQGKEAATQSPKAPAHYVPYPGCVRTLPHGRLPWAPVLACSTQFFGLRAFLSGSLISLLPTLGFSHTRHWSWGTHGACLLCPHISTASQGSAHLPHRPGPSPYPAPRVGHGLAQGLQRVTCVPAGSDQVCCCWPWGQDQKAAAFSERERQRLGG